MGGYFTDPNMYSDGGDTPSDLGRMQEHSTKRTCCYRIVYVPNRSPRHPRHCTA
jgi:hypothetical protein